MTRRNRDTICILALLWAGPVGAEDETQSAPDQPSTEPLETEPKKRKGHNSFGMGLGHFNANAPGTAHDVNDLGVAFNVRSGTFVRESTRINVDINFGITSFSRTAEQWDKAYSLGEWTTNAYGDVHEWSMKEDDWAVFRWMLSWFAYMGLFGSYTVAGGMYVISPFAATTWLGFDVTVSENLNGDGTGPYLEAGLGALGYRHPLEPEVRGGVGPVIGGGIDFESFNVGGRVLWSPPFLHGADASHQSDIFTVSITAGVQK